jgi:hypothetical protein
MRLPFLLVALCLGRPAFAAGVEDLAAAYPEQIAGVEDGTLVWRDGTRMPVSDGIEGKSEEELIADPDIDDMFHFVYPAGMPAAAPSEDPGRIRNAAFFQQMYGDCFTGEVERRLVTIDWLPRHGGGRLRVTSVNGVAERLQAVSDELDRLPDDFARYLVPSAGTYNCRPIAGTTQPSAHGYGIAIDLNVDHANYWRWGGDYENRIPDEIVTIFERQGFIWGGKWRHFDTMHFEYRPELLP